MSNLTIRDKLTQIEQALEKRQAAIARSLPAHVLSPHRFQQCILTACAGNTALLDCTPASLFGAVIRGASLGLDPEVATGQMYLVPFGKVVTLIIGYKGLVNLAWQTGQLAKVSARSVRAGDVFDLEYGSDEKLIHKPKFVGAGQPGEFTHFYATAKMIGAEEAMFDAMEVGAVEAIRSRSPSARKNGGPWTTDFEAMAKKTVLRRLAKLLPASTEKAANLQRAIHFDERADLGLKQNNAELLNEEDPQDEVDEQALSEGARAAEKDHK